MKIAVIGAGAMGGSTVKGLIATGQEKAQDITVSDPSEKVLQQFAQMGTSVTSDNSAAVMGADVVMVFVKPWLVEPVLKGIKDSMDYEKQLLVVVAARCLRLRSRNGWELLFLSSWSYRISPSHSCRR